MQRAARSGWLDGIVLTAAALFSVLAAFAFSIAPKHGSEAIAVVFAPWTGAADALSRSTEPGGRFVRFGGFDFIAVIQPDQDAYAQKVRANGAWFVADPVALAACLQPLVRRKI